MTLFQQVAESAALFLAGFNPGLPSVSVQQSSSPLPANLTFHPEDTGEHWGKEGWPGLCMSCVHVMQGLVNFIQRWFHNDRWCLIRRRCWETPATTTGRGSGGYLEASSSPLILKLLHWISMKIHCDEIFHGHLVVNTKQMTLVLNGGKNQIGD